MTRYRMTAMLLCLLLLCAGAGAEESFAIQALRRAPAIQMEISCSAETLAPLSGDALTAACEGLSRLRLRLTVGQDVSGMTVFADRDVLLDACARRDAAGSITYFPLTGNAYRTGKDALFLLTGAAEEFPPVYRLPEKYGVLADALFSALDSVSEGKTVEKSTAVKNAAASPARTEYILTAEEMNAAWPELLAALRPEAGQIIGTDARLWAAANDIRFTGDLTVKRLLDRDGQDMGVQLNGVCGVDEDQRKVTLQYGFTPDKGGSFTFSAPAVKGKDTCKLSCHIKLTAKNGKNTCALNGSYSRKKGGEAASAEGEGTFQRTTRNGTEEWTGSLMLSVNAGGKAVYTLRPKLTGDGTGLHGEIGIRKKQGKTKTLDMTLSLTLTASDGEMPAPDIAAVTDAMSAQDVQTLLTPELQGLSRKLIEWLGTLPGETRAQLTHQLRTDDWTTRKDSVPPLEKEAETQETIQEE